MKAGLAMALARAVHHALPEVLLRIEAMPPASAFGAEPEEGEEGYWLLGVRPYVHADGYNSFELIEINNFRSFDAWQDVIRRATNCGPELRAEVAKSVKERQRDELVTIYGRPDTPLCPVSECAAPLREVAPSHGGGAARYICPMAISEAAALRIGWGSEERAVHDGVPYYQERGGVLVRTNDPKAARKRRTKEANKEVQDDGTSLSA